MGRPHLLVHTVYLEDTMVHFFRIFDLGKLPRHDAPEAPAKTSFFGGQPDIAWGAVPLSRAEQDACYLTGKAPEPDTAESSDPRAERSDA